jgi:protein-S-isoprenylcysteine O-methyltransferase Ste14
MAARTTRGAVLVILQFALLALLIVLPGGSAPGWARPTALVLWVIAALVLVAAALALRPALTVMPEPKAGAPLVTHSIYGHVRHPMYSAVLLVAWGLALGVWTIPAVAAVSALTAVLLTKARLEDALLRQRWGQRAMDYQRVTGGLLPRLRPRA